MPEDTKNPGDKGGKTQPDDKPGGETGLGGVFTGPQIDKDFHVPDNLKGDGMGGIDISGDNHGHHGGGPLSTTPVDPKTKIAKPGKIPN